MSRRSSRRSDRDRDRELYPDDSNSMVSSRRSSYASRMPRQIDYPMRRGSPMLMDCPMMGGPPMMGGRPIIDVFHAPDCPIFGGSRYGGSIYDNSRAVVLHRSRDECDDTHSRVSRHSSRTSTRDRERNERASEQSDRLYARQSESRRSRSRSRSLSLSSDSTIRSRDTARQASRSEDMAMVRRQRSPSRSHDRSRERELILRDHKLALRLHDEERGQSRGLRDGLNGVRYSSGLDSLDMSKFGSGDKVDFKQKKNIEKRRDGSVVINDEMDVKLRLGGKRPGGR